MNPAEAEELHARAIEKREAEEAARLEKKGARLVGWLHRTHPTAYIITARAKELWLRAGKPEHVENYTVPVYLGESLAGPSDAEVLAGGASSAIERNTPLSHHAAALFALRKHLLGIRAGVSPQQFADLEAAEQALRSAPSTDGVKQAADDEIRDMLREGAPSSKTCKEG